MSQKKPSKLKPKFKGYTNGVEVYAIAPFDFRIDFLLHSVGEQSTKIAQLNMSPQIAKALLILLRKTIEKFEGTFGEIKIAPDEIDFGKFGPRF